MYFTKENIAKPSVIAFWRLLHPTPCFHGLYFTLCENQQHILKHLSNHFMNGVVMHIFVWMCVHNKNRTALIMSSALYLTPNDTIHFMFFCVVVE